MSLRETHAARQLQQTSWPINSQWTVGGASKSRPRRPCFLDFTLYFTIMEARQEHDTL